MKRYSILVTEFGSDREVELCQVDGDPGAIVKRLEAKTLMIRSKPGVIRRSATRKYTGIRVVDNGSPLKSNF